MLSSATLFITHLKPPFLLYINLYLEKIYFKKQTDHSLKAYKKQRKNYCSRLYKKVRRETFPQNDKEIADEVNSFFKSTIPNLEKKIIICFITSQTSLASSKGLLKLLGYTCLLYSLIRICFCFVKGSHYYYYY